MPRRTLPYFFTQMPPHLPYGPSSFIEEVRGDDPELASYPRIEEERELEAGGLN